ncbi:hypothetical protein BJV78DRAFT_1276240 [Lactifluus subvellereus]|nr:hypothetical protein BJV78DRAFT_1276240 [Lactifluus subvellereus]
MPARHFLCCLPLRLGALLISVFQCATSGLIAAASWYALSSMRGHLPGKLKTLIIANGVYHTVLALAAFVGFIGTLGRKARLLSTYSFYLSWSIGVQIIVDAAYLWAFFSTSRETLIQRCIDGSTDKEVQDICNHSFDTGRWTLVASIAIGLLIQIWAAYIVSSYAQKLNDENWRYRPGVVPIVGGGGPRYANLKPDDRDETHFPLAGGTSYPYSDSHNSFGRNQAIPPVHYNKSAV